MIESRHPSNHNSILLKYISGIDFYLSGLQQYETQKEMFPFAINGLKLCRNNYIKVLDFVLTSSSCCYQEKNHFEKHWILNWVLCGCANIRAAPSTLTIQSPELGCIQPQAMVQKKRYLHTVVWSGEAGRSELSLWALGNHGYSPLIGDIS